VKQWIVVGAGFAGAVLAERIASQLDETVLVIDKRPHIAGNAFDVRNEAGILIHQYGPHIFHTNSQAIFDYLSQFTAWRSYEHRVLASVDGRLVPVPINRTTVNTLYGLNLTSQEMEAFYQSRAEPIDEIRTSADVVLARVGRDLYEKFFRGYTRKQWGLDPSELDKSVTARVPARIDDDDRYFLDAFQFMPAHGYTEMFSKMLAHRNIEVSLETPWEAVKGEAAACKGVIFTGPIDEFYDYRFGKLPYRSLHFQHETMDCETFQPVAVVNYPQDRDYTRITEYKHLTGEQNPKTSITYEYPSDEGDPFYPIPRTENQALFKLYEQLAIAEANVHFVGRLATYRYYNMDQVVGQALATFRKLCGERG
jgi:UDP-galactopyranose mutase